METTFLPVLQGKISSNFVPRCSNNGRTKLYGWFVDVTLLFWSREKLSSAPRPQVSWTEIEETGRWNTENKTEKKNLIF